MSITHEWRTLQAQEHPPCTATWCDHLATECETITVERSPASHGRGFVSTRYFCAHHAAVVRTTRCAHDGPQCEEEQ